ncbi:uncharacterized protein G2W53_041115 [Senna tora]|uniref:Uncharacterized protein n=1 Tax=Senna tora TaxID=362788 RepID=A0A834SRE8_9FABA|nr:uncharacterized protein G2W53_041115 [Senna tora]
MICGNIILALFLPCMATSLMEAKMKSCSLINFFWIRRMVGELIVFSDILGVYFQEKLVSEGIKLIVLEVWHVPHDWWRALPAAKALVMVLWFGISVWLGEGEIEGVWKEKMVGKRFRVVQAITATFRGKPGLRERLLLLGNAVWKGGQSHLPVTASPRNRLRSDRRRDGKPRPLRTARSTSTRKTATTMPAFGSASSATILCPHITPMTSLRPNLCLHQGGGPLWNKRGKDDPCGFVNVDRLEFAEPILARGTQLMKSSMGKCATREAGAETDIGDLATKMDLLLRRQEEHRRETREAFQFLYRNQLQMEEEELYTLKETSLLYFTKPQPIAPADIPSNSRKEKKHIVIPDSKDEDEEMEDGTS